MSKKPIDLMLVVRCDYNDADFITKFTPVTEEEIARFLPLIEAIKKFKPYTGQSDPKQHPGSTSTHSFDHNWGTGEYGYRDDLGQKSIVELYKSDEISEDLIQEFDETYVPNPGDAGGFGVHTIVEIFVVKLDRKLFTASNHYSGWAIV